MPAGDPEPEAEAGTRPRSLLAGLLGLLRDRNAILILAIVLGALLGPVARWTQPLTLPALALVMTVSATQISSRALLSPRRLVRPALLAVLFSYGLSSGVMLALARWLLRDADLWTGFVLVAAVPPGVAVVPFSYLLAGDTALALVGTLGAYLAALAITPAMALALLGESALQPARLLVVLGQVVGAPLLLSRVLLAPRFAGRVERWRGTIVNWGFFVVVFTVVGLNRDMFLRRPGALALTLAIALAGTFGLGTALDLVLRRLAVGRGPRVTLSLMGTVKNSGLAAATALALFGETASLPGAVVSAVQVLYLVYLGLRWQREAEA